MAWNLPIRCKFEASSSSSQVELRKLFEPPGEPATLWTRPSLAMTCRQLLVVPQYVVSRLIVIADWTMLLDMLAVCVHPDTVSVNENRARETELSTQFRI